MMKKIYCLVCAMILFLSLGLAQEKKHIAFKAGMGYFVDLFVLDHGKTIWLEGGFELQNNYIITGNITMADVRYNLPTDKYSDPLELYTNAPKNVIMYYLADICFSKNLKFGKNALLNTGMGLGFRSFYAAEPSYSLLVNSETGETAFYFEYKDYRMQDIGLCFNVDYMHQFGDSFYAGMRTKINYYIGLGFEGLIVSPMIGIFL